MNLYLIFNSGEDKKKLIKYYHNYENSKDYNMIYETYSKGYYYFNTISNNQATRRFLTPITPRVVESESDSDDESDDEPAIRTNNLNTQARPDDSDDDDETGGELVIF